MSNVLRLVRPSHADSIALLKGMLRRAIAGDLAGVALCSRSAGGADQVALTGVYAENPDAALSATIRLTLRLTQEPDNG